MENNVLGGNEVTDFYGRNNIRFRKVHKPRQRPKSR